MAIGHISDQEHSTASRMPVHCHSWHVPIFSELARLNSRADQVMVIGWVDAVSPSLPITKAMRAEVQVNVTGLPGVTDHPEAHAQNDEQTGHLQSATNSAYAPQPT
jgi:hypothetical protein